MAALTGTSATFSGKIAFSANSGATASGQIGRDATYGMFQWASTGSTDDWTVFSPSLGYIMHVPTGTVNTVFGGSISGTSATFSDVVSSAYASTNTADPTGGVFYSLQNTSNTNNNWSTIRFKDAQGNDAGYIGVQYVDHTNNRGDVVILARPSGGNITEVARFLGTGATTLAGALTGTSATFSSSVTSSLGSTGANFNSNAATTGAVNAYRVSNTTGVGSFGLESSAGGSLITGGSAYATVLQSISNTDLQFGTNQTTRLTIASTGAATFSSTVTATGFFESSSILLKDIISRDGDVAYFKWKNKQDDKIHIGYIAEEKQLTNPDQINSDGEFLAVNYLEILVEKVRKLEKEVEQLKSKR
jgi:hypothetical protein